MTSNLKGLNSVEFNTLLNLTNSIELKKQNTVLKKQIYRIIRIKEIYRISSNERPRHLLNFETVACGAF